MNTHPVRVLFDPGSQVNTISPKAVERLQLKPDVMQRAWELRMPGNTTTELSLGFYQLCFTLLGYTRHHKCIPLVYSTSMLVLDSSYDILLGLPFMRHRCLTQHYCNNTLHTVSLEGAHITIPLESSNLQMACTHKCPFQYLSLPTHVDIKSAVNPFDNIAPKMITPSAYTTQTNNVSMCHSIVTAKQVHIPMRTNGILTQNDVIPKYNIENRSITLNNIGIPMNNSVIPRYNVNGSNISMNNNVIPRYANVIQINDMEKHCQPLNNNVIVPYNVENQCQTLKNSVIRNYNNRIPHKNNVIPSHNIESQCKTLNNNVIPINDSVIPKDNDVISMNKSCTKSNKIMKEVVPTISSDTKDIPNDELSYTTGIDTSSKYNNQYSIENALLCTPAVFMQHAMEDEAVLYCCLIKTMSSQSHDTPTTDGKYAELLKQQSLNKYPTLFPETLPPELPPSDRVTHGIELIPNAKIPPRKLYRQSVSELSETKKQLTEYINTGHIRPSTSPFGAPILLVLKKDGTMRMCIDYRGLNDITVKNTFPIPRIDDLHDQLGKAHYFTKLDLYSSYHQIQITTGDEHKTAFTSRYGTYEFTVMPFGLTNAPSTFQTAMHALFHDWLDEFVIVYLDDILVYSPTQEKHTRHVLRVLQRLNDNQWYCKLKKCEFAQTSIEYLGHIISKGTIAIDPEKMKAVQEWPIPFKNLTEVQSFLGLVGYYRKFIPYFSHIAKPLHEFSHKDKAFVWESKHTEAVDKLKNAVLSSDYLAIFDPDRETILTTDACEYALGATLNQVYEQEERPIAFISKILIAAEKNYAMWEKELFAVIWAIKYFRPYLTGHQFHIRLDNKPTTQLLSNLSIKLTTTTSNRVARWINMLQTFRYTIKHHPGKSNVVADALSRFPLIANLSESDMSIIPKDTYVITPITDVIPVKDDDNSMKNNDILLKNDVIPRVNNVIPSISTVNQGIFKVSSDIPKDMLYTNNITKNIPSAIESITKTGIPPLIAKAPPYISVVSPNDSMLNEFIIAYKEDKPLKVIYESLLNGEYHARYRLYKSLIVTREDKFRVYIPDNAKLRMKLFTEAHNTPLAGHPGFHKMYSYIRRYFVGPHIREDILDFVRSCPECQTTKPRHNKPYGVIMPIEPPQEPWNDISMNLITGLTKSNNCTAILVVVDRFSKMAHFIPINTDIDAIKLAKVFVNNIVRLHGIPKSIISDRDPRFVSAFWKELFTNIDTNLRFSTANHPQTDCQTERTNRTLE